MSRFDLPKGGQGASQTAVTLGNNDGEIGGVSINAVYTNAEVQALRGADRWHRPSGA